MSLTHSSNIVTDGLIFYYDMYNTKKSWKGWPVTNQFTLPASATNGFGVQNSTFTRVYSGNYGGYEILPTDYVWRYDITGPDCPYHGWDIPTTTGTVVTFSFDYFVSPTTVGYPSTNFLANIENVGFGSGGSFADPTPSLIGIWKKGYINATATANGNARCLLYPGACGSQLATSGFILYKNPQVEFNAPGGIPTPFVAGTRSSTQAILDLTNNNTITASSLTYGSDGNFSFNGSSNYIDITNNLGVLSGYTFCHWSRRDVESRMPIGWRSGPTFYQYGDNSWYYTHGGVSGEYYYPKSVSIPVGTWGFYCITYDGTAVRIYRNGVFEGSQATTGSADWTNGVRIGYWASGGSYYYQGLISKMSMYNRALSASEVLQNFNAHRGRFGV